MKSVSKKFEFLNNLSIKWGDIWVEYGCRLSVLSSLFGLKLLVVFGLWGRQPVYEDRRSCSLFRDGKAPRAFGGTVGSHHHLCTIRPKWLSHLGNHLDLELILFLLAPNLVHWMRFDDIHQALVYLPDLVHLPSIQPFQRKRHDFSQISACVLWQPVRRRVPNWPLEFSHEDRSLPNQFLPARHYDRISTDCRQSTQFKLPI